MCEGISVSCTGCCNALNSDCAGKALIVRSDGALTFLGRMSEHPGFTLNSGAGALARSLVQARQFSVNGLAVWKLRLPKYNELSSSAVIPMVSAALEKEDNFIAGLTPYKTFFDYRGISEIATLMRMYCLSRSHIYKCTKEKV